MTEPEIGEIVVIKVTKVLNYGAFCELLEYENKNGFIHISQVASRWVKNIRNYVKENQIRAAQVLSVDTARNQIELSLTKVSNQNARQKIEAWNQFKRAKKLMEVLAKTNKSEFKIVWGEVAEPLVEKYESLFDALQKIALDGEKATEGVPENWVKPLVELVQKSISVPMKTVKGIATIKLESSDAITVIKKTLSVAGKKSQKSEVDIFYNGGGAYEIRSTALDYKTAERDLNAIRDFIVAEIEKAKGSIEFKKTG